MQAIQFAKGWRLGFILTLFMALGTSFSSIQSASGQDTSEILARYLKVVLRSPRYGTAFERVYDAHLANQSLDRLLQQLQEEHGKSESPNPLIVRGMVYFRSGKFALAADEFDAALKQDPSIAHCHAYKARAHKQAGAPEEAVVSFRNALEAKLDRQLLIEVSTELAELLGQLRRADEALEAWEKLEAEFPNDTPILEQIASRLEQLGEFDEAKKRYVTLTKSKSSSLKKIEWAFRVAEIDLKRGSSEDALRQFEELAGRVNPQSWLFQSIRDSIDRVFLATRDYEGLIGYYRKWQESHPEDIDSLVRCGKLLSIHGEREEAISILRRAISLVPANAIPRVELINVLERDLMYEQAVAEFPGLVELEPDNLDYLDRWGHLVLKTNATREERQSLAAETWERMLNGREGDPTTVVRVADLLRKIEKTDRALELYRAAIDLAESEPQYREYLGEYLFALDRKSDAIQAWNGIATGPRSNLENWARLGEVFSAFELSSEALEAMGKACELNPTPMHRLRFSKLLRQGEQYEQAVQQAQLAMDAAEDQETLQAAWEAEIECFLAMGSLESEIQRAESSEAFDANSWHKLALMYAANNQLDAACQAIDSALEFTPNSIDLLLTGSSINERNGETRKTLSMLQQLSRIDRPSRANYIPKIASLQMQLGQLEESLETAKELINVDSATPEQFFRYVDLCDRAGKPEAAMQALRQNAFSNPREFDAVHRLSTRLFNQFKLEEAESFAWQAFDLACDQGVEELDLQESALGLLTRILLVSGRYEELDRRLVTIGREKGWTGHTELLRSIAFSQAGFFNKARRVLLTASQTVSPDLSILERLRKLALSEYDYAGAIGYQQQINKIFASKESKSQLAKLYAETGDFEEAAELLGEESREEILKNLIGLIEKAMARGDLPAVEQLLVKTEDLFPDSWEMLGIKLKFEATTPSKDYKETAKRIIALSLENESAIAGTGSSSSMLPTPPTSNRRSVNYTRMIGFMNYINRSNVRSNMVSINPATFSRMWPGIGSARELRDVALMLLGDATLGKQLIEQASKTKDRDLLWDGFFSNCIQNAPQTISRTTVGSRVTYSVPNLINESQKQALYALIDLGDSEAIEMYLSQRYSERRFIAVPQSQMPKMTPLEEGEIQKLVGLISGLPSSRTRASYLTWALQECDLASVEPKELLKLHAADNTSAIGWMGLIPSFGQSNSPSARFVLDNVFRRAREENIGLDRLLYLDYYLIGILNSEADQKSKREQSLAYLRDLLDLQAFKLSRASKRLLQFAEAKNPVSIRTSQTVTSLSSRTINSRNQVADFPLPNSLLTMPVIQGLFRCHLHSDKLLQEEVRILLQELVDRKKSKSDEVVALLALAAWDWWKKDTAASIASMERAYALGLGEEQVAVQLATLYSKEKRYADALQLLDSIEPRTSGANQSLEKLRLSLAEKVGNVEEVKAIALRLFAITNDKSTEAQLLKTVKAIRFTELEDLIRSRQATRSQLSLGSDISLLDYFIATEQTDPATAIAESILRKSKLDSLDVLLASVPLSSRNAISTAQIRSGRNRETPRSKALDYMKRVGRLPMMIDEAEKAYSELKDQFTARRLVELYIKSGRRADATKVAMEAAPENSMLAQRLKSASLTELVTNGKTNEALAILKPLLEKNPSYLNQPQNLALVNRLAGPNGVKELVELLIETKALKSLQNPALTSAIIRGLISKKENGLLSKVVLTQFESLGFNMFTTLSLSPSFGGVELFAGFETERDSASSVRFRELFVDKLLEDDGLAFKNWKLPSSHLVNAANGKLALLLNVLGESEQLARLVSSLESKVAAGSTTTSTLMLSYLLAKQGEVSRAEALLASAAKGHDLADDFQAVWEICMAISKGQEESAVVDSLIERIVKEQPHHSSRFDASPRQFLLQRYLQKNRVTEARILIDNWLQIELSLLRRLQPSIQNRRRADKYVDAAGAYDLIGEFEDSLLLLSKAVDVFARESSSYRSQIRTTLGRAESFKCVRDRDLRTRLLLEGARNSKSKLHQLVKVDTKALRNSFDVWCSFHDLASFVEFDSSIRAQLLDEAESLSSKSRLALFALASVIDAEEQQVELAKMVLEECQSRNVGGDKPSELPRELVFLMEHLPKAEEAVRLRLECLKELRKHNTSELGSSFGFDSTQQLVDAYLMVNDRDSARNELDGFLKQFGRLSYAQRFDTVWKVESLCARLEEPDLELAAIRAWLSEPGAEVRPWLEDGFLPASYGTPGRRTEMRRVQTDFKRSELQKRLTETSARMRERNVDPNSVFETLFALVFPPKTGDIRPLFGASKSTLSTFSTLHQDPLPRLRRYSLLSDLITWSVQAEKSHQIVAELTKRQIDSARNEKDAILISVVEIAIAFEKNKFDEGNAKLQDLITKDNLSNGAFLQYLSLVFNRLTEEKGLDFSVEDLAALSATKIRTSGDLQHLLVLKIQEFFREGRQENAKEAIQLMEAIHAYRDVTKKQRQQSIYQCAVRLAQSCGNEELEAYYQQLLTE